MGLLSNIINKIKDEVNLVSDLANISSVATKTKEAPSVNRVKKIMNAVAKHMDITLK